MLVSLIHLKDQLSLICFRKSKIINVKPLKSSWKKKQEDKINKKLLKAYEQELKDSANKQKEVIYTSKLA